MSASSVNTTKGIATLEVNDSGVSYSPNYNNTNNITLNGTYPSSYDLRSTGKLTPVKNQGNTGDCWTFGTIGSLESNLLPVENDDFSENNMKNVLNSNSPVGFDLDDGGTYDMALAYLAGWEGPVYESQDPYSDSSVYSSNEILNPVKHVQDVLMLPSRANSLDNNYIKWALMNYGAVGTYMYMDESSKYYNSATYSYYYNGAGGINHALDIVGWDDNYDKNNFDIAAPGNGAFIIKNSWGTNWGDNGYFYVSYYDTELGIGKATGGSNSPNFVFIDAENASNYNKNYQYNPYGWVDSDGYNSNTGWFSNVFNSTGNDVLSAASFYVYSPKSTYNLYIYLNPTKNNPKSGTLVSSLTGTLMSGYWTINLDSPVNLLTGELFSVVVKLTTPGYKKPIPVQYAETGYSSRAKVTAGESYISSNGLTWTDASTRLETVCLKAFTAPHIIQSTTLILNTISGVKGDILNLTAKLTNNITDQPLNGTIIKFFINGVDIGSAVTNINGEAVLNYTLNDNPGIYQVLALFEGSYDYGTSNFTSNLTIIDNTPPSITINQVGSFYNTILKIYLTTTDPDSTAVTYYTLDGSNPQTSVTRILYNGTEINISNTTTLIYTAVDPANNWSPNYNQTYTLDTTAPTVTINQVDGFYGSNQTIKISANDNDPNIKIYYTLDGTDPTVNSTIYTGPLSIGKEGKNILKSIAVDTAGNISNTITRTYTIDTTAPTANTNPIGRYYNSNKTVTLSMSEKGTIYYTLNGTTPTSASSKYTGPIYISSTKTLKYLAVGSRWKQVTGVHKHLHHR